MFMWLFHACLHLIVELFHQKDTEIYSKEYVEKHQKLRLWQIMVYAMLNIVIEKIIVAPNNPKQNLRCVMEME